MHILHKLGWPQIGIAFAEPAYPDSSGRSTTQKYSPVKGSVKAGMDRVSGSNDAPDQYGTQDGYAQGVHDVRSMNKDRKQSAV